jgi:Spy/CpxP family protein refolding chaperone
MKGLTMTLGLVVSLAPYASAQTGGGRKGGEGGPRTMCVNPLIVEKIEVVKGAAIAAQLGPDAEKGVAILYPKPGIPLNAVLAQCAGMAGEDILLRHGFSPELVMSHQQAIGLTDAQRSALATVITDVQRRVIADQFTTSAEVEKLQGLMDANPANETQVLEQLDRVLASEREIKREQLALMVRVKNNLTPQQQAQLDKLRAPRD